jgi:hypothetical protein
MVVANKALKLLGAQEVHIKHDKAFRIMGIDSFTMKNQKAMTVLGITSLDTPMIPESGSSFWDSLLKSLSFFRCIFLRSSYTELA